MFSVCGSFGLRTFQRKASPSGCESDDSALLLWSTVKCSPDLCPLQYCLFHFFSSLSPFAFTLTLLLLLLSHSSYFHFIYLIFCVSELTPTVCLLITLRGNQVIIIVRLIITLIIIYFLFCAGLLPVISCELMMRAADQKNT